MTYAKAFLWIGSVVMVGAAIAIQYTNPAGPPPAGGGVERTPSCPPPRQPGGMVSSFPAAGTISTGCVPVAALVAPTVSADVTNGGRPHPFIVRKFEVTAYCPCEKCCGSWARTPWNRRRLASGERLAPLVAAGERFVAGPRGLPFGTMVWISGYADGYVPVLDRGGAIKRNRLDVFYRHHADALAFGRRTVAVRVREATR